MPKVEGSSPFIGSSKAPLRRGFSFVAQLLPWNVAVHGELWLDKDESFEERVAARKRGSAPRPSVLPDGGPGP